MTCLNIEVSCGNQLEKHTRIRTFLMEFRTRVSFLPASLWAIMCQTKILGTGLITFAMLTTVTFAKNAVKPAALIDLLIV